MVPFLSCKSKSVFMCLIEPMLNKTVSGEMAQDSRGTATITHLKPYTTYMVTIALITKHGEGLHSDPLLNTTLEGGINYFLYDSFKNFICYV